MEKEQERLGAWCQLAAGSDKMGSLVARQGPSYDGLTKERIPCPDICHIGL